MWAWFWSLLLALVGLAGLVSLFHWMAWILQWGRYRPASAVPAPISARPALWMVVAEFFIKLINDFRHLLALSVIFMFVVVTCLLLFPGLWMLDVKAMGEGLKAVTSSLGTLVASVIGYYFGESAGKKSREEPRVERPLDTVVQRPTTDPSGPHPVGPPKKSTEP